MHIESKKKHAKTKTPPSPVSIHKNQEHHMFKNVKLISAPLEMHTLPKYKTVTFINILTPGTVFMGQEVVGGIIER